MLKTGTILCLFVAILFCIGCGDGGANLNLSNADQPKLATDYDCQNSPDCFFERYPENWEHALYEREMAARYQRNQLAKK